MDSDAYATVTLAKSTHLNNNLAVVAFAMLYYDYSLTISREIEHFWKGARLSFASALFVLNRYLGLLGPIPIFFEYFGHHKCDPLYCELIFKITLNNVHRCRHLQRYHQYYAVISQVIVGIRTYALYNRSRLVLLGLILFAFALLIVTLVSGNLKAEQMATSDTPYYGAIDSCDLATTSDQGLRSAIGWLAMLCLDTTVFALTLVRTIQMRHNIYQPGLLMILFRDGAFYYAILALANAGNVLTFMVPTGGYWKRGLVTTLANALSTTLVSRIFLNLRDPSLHGGARGGGRWSLSGLSEQGVESMSPRISFCRPANGQQIYAQPTNARQLAAVAEVEEIQMVEVPSALPSRQEV